MLVGDHELLECGVVGHADVAVAHAADGRVEVVEGEALDAIDDLRADATEREAFVRDDGPVGLSHARGDRLLVEGTNRPEVDDLDLDALFREDFGCFECHVDDARPRDHGAVFALAGDARLAERNGERRIVRHVALHAVERLAFEDEDGVLVANGRLHHAVRVFGGRRRDALQARHVSVEMLHRVGVLAADLFGRAVRAAEDDRHVELAARHLAELRGVVDDLVERDGGEVPRHELDDGAEPDHGCADSHAREAALRDRRVEHPLRAELFEHAFGDFVGPLVVADFFAHQDHHRVSIHLLDHRGAEGFPVTKLTHGFS